jgi:hypothetical protein
MLTRSLLKTAFPITIVCLVFSTEIRAGIPFETILQVEMIKPKGPIKSLEEQVLDFRYAPQRWQACIGLPDDPHKSIVGSDGALYYDFGGGRFLDFHTRVRAELETDGAQGYLAQRLLDPRIPVVITERKIGDLVLRQKAWAGIPRSRGVKAWSRERVDYLWLELENPTDRPQQGRIILKIDTDKRLYVDQDRQHVYDTEDQRPFCAISPKCVSFLPQRFDGERPIPSIHPQRLPSVSRNWGQPNRPCAERYKDVLVGYNRPLAFSFPAESGEVYRVVFGLIESWHSVAGKRPLELFIEGQSVRRVDLVAEYGQHCPIVLSFTAQDKNRDGRLEMGIHPAADAEDQNTILTALWVYKAEDAPSDSLILHGQADSKALGLYEALSRIERPVRLHFEETQLQPHRKEQALIAIARGLDARLDVSLDTAPQKLDRAIHYWHEEAGLPFDRIRVPDPAVQGLLDSCIRNIYQARELRNGVPAFQVGPTCYRGTWAADGPFILEAVTYLGRGQEARAGLELQVEQDEGPGGVAFSKKTGLRLWMILRHWQLTGDHCWLMKMWPQVESNVIKIITYRRMTMEDPSQVNYGLMPIGFGDGGLGGRHREYTNVYWTLVGLQAAIEIAQVLKQPVAAVWQSEFQDYWDFMDKARQRDKLEDEKGNTYVPVTMRGEEKQLPQRGAWAFLQSIYPGNLFAQEDPLMRGTLAMLDAHQKEGLIFGTGWDPNGIWSYAGSFYGHAHLWLGHGRKAAATLYAFGNHACPLLCWREEHNPQGAPEKYIGDMPHNWASAEFIRMIRHLLILERGRELHLFEGMPTAWSYPGAKLYLVDIPTRFGSMTLSMSLAEDGRCGTIRIIPPARNRMDRMVVHLEHFHSSLRSVKMDDNEIFKKAVPLLSDDTVILTLDFAEQSKGH